MLCMHCNSQRTLLQCRDASCCLSAWCTCFFTCITVGTLDCTTPSRVHPHDSKKPNCARGWTEDPTHHREGIWGTNTHHVTSLDRVHVGSDWLLVLALACIRPCATQSELPQTYAVSCCLIQYVVLCRQQPHLIKMCSVVYSLLHILFGSLQFVACTHVHSLAKGSYFQKRYEDKNVSFLCVHNIV